jgi:hypothetical protein
VPWPICIFLCQDFRGPVSHCLSVCPERCTCCFPTAIILHFGLPYQPGASTTSDRSSTRVVQSVFPASRSPKLLLYLLLFFILFTFTPSPPSHLLLNTPPPPRISHLSLWDFPALLHCSAYSLSCSILIRSAHSAFLLLQVGKSSSI